MIFNHIVSPKQPGLSTTIINGKRHYLTPDGILPSVSTVCGYTKRDIIKQWEKKVGEKEVAAVRHHATTRGNTLHDACEHYLLNNPLEDKALLPKDWVLFHSIKPWLDSCVNNIHYLETPIYSKTVGLAGRVDCCCEWDGQLAILDFKGSRRTRNDEYVHSYLLQCCGYALILEDLLQKPIKQLVILMATENQDNPQIWIKETYNYVEDLRDAIDAYNKDHSNQNVI